MLHLYNSMTKQLERFEPIQPGKVGMYVCGVTVYDRCHLGHARAMVCFDVIARFLKFSNYDVTFVRNITDIDDKIIERAKKRSISIEDLTAEQIDWMHNDTDALGIKRPDIEPKATEYIDEMIALITRLISQGVAYISEEGDVCFEIARFPTYGKLSHRQPTDLLAGARIEVASGKRSPLDFVLWKRAKPHEKSWPSPWGNGRPGWHIECSAMATTVLGETIDIHGGGLDLKFPHHENEIAQSEAATGCTFARYWLHVGLLNINDEKMAKSLGNFFTIDDILKQYHPEVLRYFFVSSHYRSPLNYTDLALLNAHKSLARLYNSLKDIENFEDLTPDENWIFRFMEAMNDDINTPLALSILFELSHEINKTKDKTLAKTLMVLGSVFGFFQDPPGHFLKQGVTLASEEIEKLIETRKLAKQQKDFKKADAIREELMDLGILLEDTASGTSWRKKVE